MLTKLDNYRGPELEGQRFNLFSGEEYALTIHPMDGCVDKKIFRTGLECHIPVGRMIMVTSSAGLFHKHGITMMSASVFDENSFGELKVVLANLGDKPYTIYPGDKVAEVCIIRKGGI